MFEKWRQAGPPIGWPRNGKGLPCQPLNWVAGIGVLPIPGLGPFIAAGPIIAALSAAAGGDIAGGLMSLGVSELEARRYERELDDGNILLCVHTDDAGDIARAKGHHAAGRSDRRHQDKPNEDSTAQLVVSVQKGAGEVLCNEACGWVSRKPRRW